MRTKSKAIPAGRRCRDERVAEETEGAAVREVKEQKCGFLEAKRRTHQVEDVINCVRSADTQHEARQSRDHQMQPAHGHSWQGRIGWSGGDKRPDGMGVPS